jgi:hypothetical protein
MSRKNTNARPRRGTTTLRALPDPDPTPSGGRTAAEDKLWAALRAHPGATTPDLATHAGIARSTAGKILTAWERDDTATRTPAPTQGARRAPDTWTPTDHPSSDQQEAPASDGGQDSPGNTANTDTDDSGSAGGAEPAGQEPVADTAAATTEGTAAASTRLGKGALRGLVEEYLAEHPDLQFSPSAIAHALGRSSGAVANICGSSEAGSVSADMVTGVLAELQAEGRVSRVGAGEEAVWQVVERSTQRLAKGALHGLVEDFLVERRGQEFGASAIGKALGRSSGAVANALVRLTERGVAVQTGERPVRYSAAPSD